MKSFLLVLLVIVAAIALVVFLVRKYRSKKTSPVITQDRIVAHVTDHLNEQRANRSVRPSSYRTTPVVEYRKASKPVTPYSRKSNDESFLAVEGDYPFNEEPSYYSTPTYDPPAYQPPASTSYDSGSTPSNYGSDSGSNSSSYDSGSSSSPSSSDY